MSGWREGSEVLSTGDAPTFSVSLPLAPDAARAVTAKPGLEPELLTFIEALAEADAARDFEAALAGRLCPSDLQGQLESRLPLRTDPGEEPRQSTASGNGEAEDGGDHRVAGHGAASRD